MGGLFDEGEEEEDLFSITKPKQQTEKAKPRAASLLFEDEQEDEGDLFAAPSAAPAPAATKPVER